MESKLNIKYFQPQSTNANLLVYPIWYYSIIESETLTN